MTRWLWMLLAAVVLIGVGVFLWTAGNQTTTPNVTQRAAPSTPAPTPSPVAQAPAPAPAAPAPAPSSPKDLITALNNSVVSFPSGSAEVPAKMANFLQSAAKDLKQIPAGHVLEIAGYTDSDGSAADNIVLSQRRADAVREALIRAGANPDMLVAKGYGSADPIASNDTPEGRLRNRRIEYHIITTPKSVARSTRGHP